MSSSLAPPAGLALAGLRDLLGEVGDCKRIRSAGRTGSIAERGFVDAWSALCAGAPVDDVMRVSAAHALAAARLGDVDASKLAELGLDAEESKAVLRRAFDAVAAGQDPTVIASLRLALGEDLPRGETPPFAYTLSAQPRAGATCPGRPRLVLQPGENHAEHCWATAVFGVLLAPRYGADPERVFLAALAHHLHNAFLPDSGFTGEMLLAEHLAPICEAATGRALAQLDGPLRQQVVAARSILPDAATPEGRAFHAADVIDRVMEFAQHLRVADVTLPRILDEWQLVHAGPVRTFHETVLAEMGLT